MYIIFLPFKSANCVVAVIDARQKNPKPVHLRPILSQAYLPNKYAGISTMDCHKKFKNGFPLMLLIFNIKVYKQTTDEILQWHKNSINIT